MKKILTLLSAITITATSSSIVVSCAGTQTNFQESYTELINGITSIIDEENDKVNDDNWTKANFDNILVEVTKKMKDLAKKYGDKNDGFIFIENDADAPTIDKSWSQVIVWNPKIVLEEKTPSDNEDNKKYDYSIKFNIEIKKEDKNESKKEGSFTIVKDLSEKIDI